MFSVRANPCQHAFSRRQAQGLHLSKENRGQFGKGMCLKSWSRSLRCLPGKERKETTEARACRGRPVSGRQRRTAEGGERKRGWKARGSPPRRRPGVQPGLSAERPSFRRVLDCGQQAKTIPPRPSGVLAPSRVQRRGVRARRVREPCEGGEARERRAGGTSRAARQRREVETLILSPRSALLVTKYGGFNEVQETPPFDLSLARPGERTGRCV